MSEANKKVALQFIEAMSTASVKLADEVVAQDAFTISKGFSKFAGKRNRDVMVGTIDAFNTIIPGGLKLNVEHVTAEGDRVVVECKGGATTSGGKPYHNDYVFIFTVKDGKITKIDEHFCGVLAEAVLWPIISAMGDDLKASEAGPSV